MRVNQPQVPLPDPPKLERAAEPSAPKTELNQHQPPDQLELTSNLGSPDDTRLEQLRREVESGTYSVPAGEISSRIVEDHLRDPAEDPSQD